MEIIDRIKELIKTGKELAPQGGTPGLGFNGKLQPEYLSWKLQSVSIITELGQSASSIINEINSDRDIPYFYEQSAQRVLGGLLAALALAERKYTNMKGNTTTETDKSISRSIDSNVFIVHGHNDALLYQVARFLEKLKLIPIILFEQPGKGRTLIEKLEQSSRACFAIILLTPDDFVKSPDSSEKFIPRARQNVIFEFGFFVGTLGRINVVALYDESVELPSDYRGVEYIKIDDSGAWKIKLAQEMKEAGLSIDFNNAL